MANGSKSLIKGPRKITLCHHITVVAPHLYQEKLKSFFSFFFLMNEKLYKLNQTPKQNPTPSHSQGISYAKLANLPPILSLC
jgi:hypothetical protein